jgi:hypothetical protein
MPFPACCQIDNFEIKFVLNNGSITLLIYIYFWFNIIAYHSRGGYISITETRNTLLPDIFIKAASEIGLDEVDVNGKEILGKIVHKCQTKWQSKIDNPETPLIVISPNLNRVLTPLSTIFQLSRVGQFWGWTIRLRSESAVIVFYTPLTSDSIY